MAVAFRAAGAFAQTTSSTTLVVSYPAGVASGDLLLLQFTSGASSPTFPAGWTKLFGPTIGSDGQGDRAFVYWRVAGGSEPSSITITFAGALASAGIISAYTGVDGAAPIDVFATANLPVSAGTGADAPSVTTTKANTQLLHLYWPWLNAGTDTVNPNAADTERYDALFTSHNYRFELADKVQAATGATGTSTANVSASYFGGLAATIALAPATAVTPVADFTGTPLTGTWPLNVAFTDASTNTPTSWAWTFGDGGTSTSQNPTHSYATAGTYTVVLVATNAAGSNTKTRTGYVTVSNPSGTFTKIQFGDHLKVTDLGSGVIRVDYV